MHYRVIVFLFLGALVLPSEEAVLRAGTILNVPGTYPTITAALSAASSGDTILIQAGLYREQLVIQKDVTLAGAGPDKTIIQEVPEKLDSTAIFIDHATVGLRDLQCYGNAGFQGGQRGVVAINSATTIRNCAFVQCYNVSVAAVNGTLDIDSLLITCVYGGASLIVDSTAIAGAPADLGLFIVNSIFHINHLTAGADIDHIINISPDFSSNPNFIGPNYPIDLAQYPQGTIENSTFFGSIDAGYGQGIRIFGNINRHRPEAVICNNRFRGMERDSSDAPTNMLTTAGISFNGWNGYAEIYGNTIQHFNSGITLYGASSAKIHDNTICDNSRYGIVTSWTGPAQPSDLGGGVYASPGNNRFYNNGLYNIFHLNDQALSATNNYWGTTDPAVIAAHIYDHTENTTFGVVTTTGYLLPVELTAFTASLRQGRVVLEWMTATEFNNAGFDVEKRRVSRTVSQEQEQRSSSSSETENESPWLSIGFVRGGGTSNVAHTYAFTDVPGMGTFDYRLKQVDNDGRYRYSQVEEVRTTLPGTFTLEQNFPNPFNPSTTIAFMIDRDSRTTLTVFDALGREQATLINTDLKAGIRYTVRCSSAAMPSGLYFYRLASAGHILVRSMTVLK